VVAKPADELGPILSRVMDILSKHDLQLDDKEFDVVIAVGGDGTLLRAVGLGKPVIGVRAGKRGLLMDVPPDKFEEVVVRLKRGEFRREEYGTLWFNYMGLRYAAFNDVALLADGAGTATLGSMQYPVQLRWRWVGHSHSSGKYWMVPLRLRSLRG